MAKINLALDSITGNIDSYVGYQRITGHLIFDIKPSEGFRRKARYVAGGQPPAYPTWLPVSMSSNRTSIAKPQRFATSRPPSPPPFTLTSATKSTNFVTLPSWTTSTLALGNNLLPGNQASKLPSGNVKPLSRLPRVGSLLLSITTMNSLTAI
jgi:hypothetical protein